MRFLDKLFGKNLTTIASNDDAGIYYTVQCNNCKALIRLRIDSRNDLSLNEAEDAYFVRKTLVDDRCFRRIEMEVVFNLQRKQTSCDVRGGTLVNDEG